MEVNYNHAIKTLETWTLDPSKVPKESIESAVEILKNGLNNKDVKTELKSTAERLEYPLKDLLESPRAPADDLPIKLRQGLQALYQVIRSGSELPLEVRNCRAYHSNILDEGMSALLERMKEDKMSEEPNFINQEMRKFFIKYAEDRLVGNPPGTYLLRKSGTVFDDKDAYYFSLSFINTEGKLSNVRLKLNKETNTWTNINPTTGKDTSEPYNSLEILLNTTLIRLTGNAKECPPWRKEQAREYLDLYYQTAYRTKSAL